MKTPRMNFAPQPSRAEKSSANRPHREILPHPLSGKIRRTPNLNRSRAYFGLTLFQSRTKAGPKLFGTRILPQFLGERFFLMRICHFLNLIAPLFMLVFKDSSATGAAFIRVDLPCLPSFKIRMGDGENCLMNF